MDIKKYLVELTFAMLCGRMVHGTNMTTIATMKRLKDQVVDATNSKLSFIAKMR
jgi:hypothetical protein